MVSQIRAYLPPTPRQLRILLFCIKFIKMGGGAAQRRRIKNFEKANVSLHKAAVSSYIQWEIMYRHKAADGHWGALLHCCWSSLLTAADTAAVAAAGCSKAKAKLPCPCQRPPQRTTTETRCQHHCARCWPSRYIDRCRQQRCHTTGMHASAADWLDLHCAPAGGYRATSRKTQKAGPSGWLAAAAAAVPPGTAR